MIELIILFIVVVVTSALVLFLVKTNVITVRSDVEQEPLLNAEFLPYGREGSLTIRDFHFCRNVDEQFQCVNPRTAFALDEPVHFRFTLETTPVNGEVMVIKNYRIKAPDQMVLLDVDDSTRLQFDLQSNKENEVVYFKDYFVMVSGSALGEYTLDLVVENPLLDKKTILSQKFRVGSGVEG